MAHFHLVNRINGANYGCWIAPTFVQARADMARFYGCTPFELPDWEGITEARLAPGHWGRTWAEGR
jgi:hypothetical protein